MQRFNLTRHTGRIACVNYVAKWNGLAWSALGGGHERRYVLERRRMSTQRNIRLICSGRRLRTQAL